MKGSLTFFTACCRAQRSVVDMKKMAGLLVLVGLICALYNFHFILLDAQLKILPKSRFTLDNTFVDARGAKKIRLLLNPELARAGFRDLLEDLHK
jgi:hypothetical protein